MPEIQCTHLDQIEVSPLDQHASKPAAAVSHPLIRSIEPGEDWCWCFGDEIAFVANFN